MKSGHEIKQIARDAFQAAYWPCVGTSVLVPLITSLASCTGVGSLILGGPLLIGANNFYVNRFMGSPEADVGTVFDVGFDNFGRKLGGYLWMSLFMFLWSLLLFALIIPGVVMIIVKGLSYSMTCYILCDCPNVKAQDALELSKRMMQGHKSQLFGFVLSFIGWIILTALTGGLLGVFYVGPWMACAEAGWYLELREECLRTGVVSIAELSGAPLTA